jgi:hypothetical protein
MSRRRGMFALVTVLTAVIGMVLAAMPAQADTFEDLPNYGNRKCLDVQTQNDYFVQLWNCTGHAEQHWSTTWISGTDLTLRLTNQRTGSCLGVDGDSTIQMARVVSAPCGSVSTVWINNYANNENFDGWHQQLKNQHSGLCLDLQWNNSANGTPIWLWPCTNQLAEFNPAQLWML